MAFYRAGQLDKTLQFDVVMKGLDRQLIRVTAPGSMKGTTVLRVGKQVSVSNPWHKKIDNVATEWSRTRLFGTDMTAADLLLMELSAHLRSPSPNSEGVVMSVAPKADFASTYSRLELTIDKTKGGVTKISYFGGDGTAVREQTRSDFTQIGGKWLPSRVTFRDIKGGTRTEIQRSNFKVNPTLADSLFSKRSLMP